MQPSLTPSLDPVPDELLTLRDELAHALATIKELEERVSEQEGLIADLSRRIVSLAEENRALRERIQPAAPAE